MVRLWLEQQGVHVGVRGDARSLGLHGLGAAYLQPVGSGVRVEGHVLRLEGRGGVAVLSEDAAEGCGEDALADVAARAHEHQGV